MSEFTINSTEVTSTGMQVKYLPTMEAYDEWAAVYDTDGNILCAMDERELATLLPTFLDDVFVGVESGTPVKIMDVGCGTGRNTLAMLRYLSSRSAETEISVVAVDLSEGMLAEAEKKVEAWSTQTSESRQARITCSVHQIDIFDSVAVAEMPPTWGNQDAIISTLVLEHIPLGSYLIALASILRVGGTALVTNMHSEMGSKAQAGFVTKDEATGESIKVRGTSFAHTNADFERAAQQQGFEVVRAMEKAVTADMVDELGERSRKWIGVNVWSGFVLRKVRDLS